MIGAKPEPAHPEEIAARVRAFVTEELIPRHADIHRTIQAEPPGHRPAILAELKAQARAQGLWNLGLPSLERSDPGTRLSNREFAPIAQTMGWLYWAPEVFNCHAPDLPNMEMLMRLATPAQRAQWLEPLLRGECSSGFAMTEPDVASSDARNIQCLMRRDGDHYVLDGKKWFVGNCGLANWRFVIVIACSEPDAAPGARHSAIVVPVDAPGFEVVRQVPILGSRHRFSPPGEVRLRGVRVPVENLLGKPGQGFAAAQLRLATARIHHCMRFLGAAELALRLMIERAARRNPFGVPLIERETFHRWVALSRIEIAQARLLVLHAAERLDAEGPGGARAPIAMIKLAVARCCMAVADRAVQVFGAAGIAEDTPIASFFAEARAFRIYDGPDEVHLRTLARLEISEPTELPGGLLDALTVATGSTP